MVLDGLQPDWPLGLLEFSHWRVHSGLLEFLRVLRGLVQPDIGGQLDQLLLLNPVLTARSVFETSRE